MFSTIYKEDQKYKLFGLLKRILMGNVKRKAGKKRSMFACLVVGMTGIRERTGKEILPAQKYNPPNPLTEDRRAPSCPSIVGQVFYRT